MRTLNGCAAVAAAGLTVLLAACGLTLKKEPDLKLGCQTRHCTCLSKTVVPFKKRATADVQWRKNGDAYCPEGFVLRLANTQ